MKAMKRIFSATMLLLCAMFFFSACSSKDQLAIAVEVAAADCPEYLGDGLTTTDVYIENGDVVYEYDMDEEYYDIEGCNDPLIKASMKAAIMEELEVSYDPDLEDFLKVVKDSEADIIYRYIGNVSGETLEIIIDNSEI